MYGQAGITLGGNVERFKGRLKLCCGQMAAVMASRLDPETTLVLKGNKPHGLRIHRRHRAVLYASDPAYLDAVLDEERGWRELPVPAMSLMVFRHRDLMGLLDGAVRVRCASEATEEACLGGGYR